MYLNYPQFILCTKSWTSYFVQLELLFDRVWKANVHLFFMTWLFDNILKYFESGYDPKTHPLVVPLRQNVFFGSYDSLYSYWSLFSSSIMTRVYKHQFETVPVTKAFLTRFAISTWFFRQKSFIIEKICRL